MCYTVIDLFAGAGGLSLGFEKLGKFEVRAFIENNENAAESYRKNRKNVKRYEDIKKVDFKEIRDNHGPIDVIIGGPPCQGFSNANRQKRKIVNGNNELVKKYVEAIRQIKPKVFVLENVKNIASNKHTFYLTQEDYNHVVNELKIKVVPKDNILYDRIEFINEIFEVISDDFRQYMINEKDYYILRSILRKKNKMTDYLEKESNRKTIFELKSRINSICSGEEWYLKLKEEIVVILNRILDKGALFLKDNTMLELFCDIQSVFKDVNEIRHENVINAISLVDGMIISKMDTYYVLDYIKSSFENLNYKFNYGILNAASFGVPQTRERFILIGICNEIYKDDEVNLPIPIFKEDEYFKVYDALYDLEKYTPTTGDMNHSFNKEIVDHKKDIYSQFVRKGNTIYNHVCTASSEVAIDRFKMIPPGKNFHSLPESMKNTYENPKRTQNTIYKRLEYDKPSDTVVNVRKSMWIHPKLDRAISAREAARLQSFPDNFQFYGSKDSVYQQIGNAVPPLLGQAIAEKVLEMLGYEDNKMS